MSETDDGIQRLSPAARFYYKLCSFDIFGEGIGLNINGRETYKTLLGSMCSLMIYIWCVLFFLDGLKEYNDPTKVP